MKVEDECFMHKWTTVHIVPTRSQRGQDENFWFRPREILNRVLAKRETRMFIENRIKRMERVETNRYRGQLLIIKRLVVVFPKWVKKQFHGW